MIKLENESYYVSIDETGAELKSLIHKKSEKEIMWQANSDIWGRTAPVLFPFVGALKEGKFEYKGKFYNGVRHGFARDSRFEILEQNETKVILKLEYSEETLKKFPFKFRFDMEYELRDNKVITRFKVKNIDKEDIYFSVGGHPGFICPLNPEEDIEDYYIEFETPETLDIWELENNLLADSKPYLLNEKIIRLNRNIFDNDALVFKNYKSKSIRLRSDKSGYSINFGAENFPYLGIWAKPGANFVCIEPWHGVTDTINSTGKIEEKEGIIKLSINEDFKCEYTIEIENL